MNNPGMHEKLRLESILTEAQRDAKREAVAMERECDFGFGQQSFHNDIVFNDLVEAFWQFFGDAEEYISLELGSGLGSWSSHMATAGVQAYGVEKHQYLVDASEEAVDRAEEQGLIEKKGFMSIYSGRCDCRRYLGI